MQVDVLIQDLTFDSEHAYVVVPGGFGKGAKVWTDRIYTVQSFPAELAGATYIQTPVADRASRSKQLITLMVTKNVDVYVGLKSGMKVQPWLADWEKTGQVIEAANTLQCYRKSFKSGDTVVLGSCPGPAMYTVVIQEQ